MIKYLMVDLGKPAHRELSGFNTCGSVKKPWEKYNAAAVGLLDRHVYHTPI
jgi:hypothetical protein